MNTKVLMLNGVVYKLRQQYFKEDKLWECSFVDDDGNVAATDVRSLICYDESLKCAKKELNSVVKENGLKYGEDNKLLMWKSYSLEAQRKIMVVASNYKHELLGEWLNDDIRLERWQGYMKRVTGLHFSKGVYDRL